MFYVIKFYHDPKDDTETIKAPEYKTGYCVIGGPYNDINAGKYIKNAMRFDSEQVAKDYIKNNFEYILKERKHSKFWVVRVHERLG